MKFPKEILVTVQEENDGTEFLVVERDVAAAAEPGANIRAARYELLEEGHIVAEPAFQPRKPRRGAKR